MDDSLLIEERRERAEEAVRAVQQRAQQNISGENKRTTPKRLISLPLNL